MSALFTKVISALFPRRCPLCGEWLDSVSPQLCTPCAEKLTEEYDRYCPLCNQTAAACTCRADALSAEDMPVITLGFYEPGKNDAITSRMIYALKQQADDSAAHLLARDLAGAILREFLATGEDVRTWTITYAPRSVTGYEEHGFDQAQRLAKLCARYTGARYENIFRRHGGYTQKELTETERLANAEASIRLRYPKRKYAGKYIVVDDILTTGATLSECTAHLRAKGAKAVRIAVPYRTLPRRPKAALWYAAAGKNSQ